MNLRTFILEALKLSGVALIAVAVTSLYLDPLPLNWSNIRDLVVVVSAVIALFGFLYRIYDDRCVRDRKIQEHNLATSVDSMQRAQALVVDIIEKHRHKHIPLYSPGSRVQWKCIVELLLSAAQLSNQTIDEDLRNRLNIEVHYTQSIIMQYLSNLGTADLFELIYYRLALQIANMKQLNEDAEFLNLAYYHNLAVEAIEQPNEGEIGGTSRTQKEMVGFFRAFIESTKRKGGRPGFPFFGQAVPVDALETIVRFAWNALDDKRSFQEISESITWGGLFGVSGYICHAKKYRLTGDGTVSEA